MGSKLSSVIVPSGMDKENTMDNPNFETIVHGTIRKVITFSITRQIPVVNKWGHHRIEVNHAIDGLTHIFDVFHRKDKELKEGMRIILCYPRKSWTRSSTEVTLWQMDSENGMDAFVRRKIAKV